MLTNETGVCIGKKERNTIVFIEIKINIMAYSIEIGFILNWNQHLYGFFVELEYHVACVLVKFQILI